MKRLIRRNAKADFRTESTIDCVDSSLSDNGGVKLQNRNVEALFTIEGPVDDCGDQSKTTPELVNKLDIFLVSVSLFLLVYDVGSDCNLTITYYVEGQILWFALTLLFIIVPAILMSIFSLMMYWIDKRVLKFSTIGWCVRILLNILLVAPLVRGFDTLMHGLRSRNAKNSLEKEKHFQNMIDEDTDTTYLRVLESTAESTPQLLLQLYILFTQPKVHRIHLIIFQILSCIVSSTSAPLCLASYNNSLRKSHKDKRNMSIWSFLFMFTWKFLLITPRLVAIALFITIFKLYVLIALLLHYVLMALFLIYEKTTFFDSENRNKEGIFVIAMALVFCIDFVSVKEKPNRYRYLMYYGLSFAETAVFIILWYLNPPLELTFLQSNFTHSSNYTMLSTNFINLSSRYNSSADFKYYYQMWPQNVRLYIVIYLLVTFLMAVILMILYYICCHPTKNIKICLSSDDDHENKTNGQTHGVMEKMMVESTVPEA